MKSYLCIISCMMNLLHCPMTCRFLRLWLEPDTARGCQDTQVHPSLLWQPSQRHTQESAKTAAVGERASWPNTHEHYSLRHSDSWPICFHRCQAQYFQTCVNAVEEHLIRQIILFSLLHIHSLALLQTNDVLSEKSTHTLNLFGVFLACWRAIVCQFMVLQ